ncbi:response regulator [Oculatella sp. LEGE 06141]|uniref:response regulator transcription factor RpaB n=1 Tax=Oculatella sp. LEGE 06141 TaxID=1828648 RepID=UPI001881D0FD|nr:response regulator [Oculatella sp. LEGE 06141]MBE9181726.1 response regulator [Oculatella sp. LEGE 06141]
MVNSGKKILIVDDEAVIRRILTTRLSMVGYQVVSAADGLEALQIFTAEAPDLVVLDVMLPKLDGYGVCQKVRETSEVPIIMLTALGDIADRVTGLKMGADDYIPKPFSPKELEARIEAILRRVGRSHPTELAENLTEEQALTIGTLRIDLPKRQVYLNDTRVRLTGMEFDLLKLLVNRSGESISRTEALEEIWGYSPRNGGDLRVVDVHISRLRSKLERDPKSPEYIHTDRGVGYFFRRLSDLSHAIGA